MVSPLGMPWPPDPPAELRREFLIAPDVAFLNHGSFGACPRPVLEAYWRWQREIEAQPVRFFRDRFDDLMAEARARLASFLGTSADNLVFVPNATTAVNLVARSILLAAGDEVLTTDHEYGACNRAWLFSTRRSGALYRQVAWPLPAGDSRELVSAFEAALSERSRVLFVSHITSASALRLPVADLCALARRFGLWSVVDGAHGPGQVDLALDELGCDVYIGNCHKWLCAPKGSAFLYARPDVQDRLEPLVVSWGGTHRDPGPSPFIDELEYGGTRDYAAALAVPAAIEFQAANDWPTVRRACLDLLEAGLAQMLQLPGALPVRRTPAALELQMAAVWVPHPKGRALARRLSDEYGVELGIQDWAGGSLARMSVQAYNKAAELERAVVALRSVAEAGWA